MRVFGEQVGIKQTDHRRAGTRRDDDVFVIGEEGEIALRHLAGLVMEAGVKGGLGAAGLAEGKIDGDSQAVQQAYGSFPHLRVEGIAQTGDEQGYPRRPLAAGGLAHGSFSVGSRVWILVLINLPEEFLKLIGQLIDFALSPAHTLAA